MIENDAYDRGMTMLGDLLKATTAVNFETVDPELFNLVTGIETTEVDVERVISLFASVEPFQHELGSPQTIRANVLAAIYQDEDAHETCTLTACLNPLHPGPCKGWKGTLHSVSPGAWHALEAARVEKANATRIKKIQALKAQGKPIPHKLLTPIVAKPHPNAGKTANAATGEAHAAGKAVSDAAGVHVNEPGKVTLGQAAKTIGPVEKGPKGKKPTLASKGIAFVIAQPKVTDQYKLDKAAKITPEQWNALSDADKVTIRGELAKVQKDGFGPQQKKAAELLTKLPEKGLAPGTPNTVTTPKGNVYQKVDLAPGALSEKVSKVKEEMGKGSSLSEAVKKVTGKEPVVKEAGKPKIQVMKEVPTKGITPTEVALPPTEAEIKAKAAKEKATAEIVEAHEKAGPPKVQTLTESTSTGTTPTSAAQAKAIAAISDAIPGVKSMPEGASDKLVQAFDKLKTKGDLGDTPQFKTAVNALANKALKVATEDKMPGLGHGDNDVHIGTFHKEIADHILGGKPGLPPLVAKMAAHHEAVAPKNVKEGIEQAAKAAHEEKAAKTKLGELTPGTPGTITTPSGKTYQKVELKPETSATPKPLSAHVKHAIAMAEGKAMGASWSKNHLAAYQTLSADEFHGLPKDVQDKIVLELHKGLEKFLDPKKKDATSALLEKFGVGKSAVKAPTPPKIENVEFLKDLHNHAVTEKQAKDVAATTSPGVLFNVAKQTVGLTPHDSPDSPEHKLNAEAAAKHLLAKKVETYSAAVQNDPAVKEAMKTYQDAQQDYLYAKEIYQAKNTTWNKINAKLELDKGSKQLSPIEKASLQQYKAYLIDHPVKSDPATMEIHAETADNASSNLNKTLAAAHQKLTGPKASEMTPAQVKSAAAELMGPEAVNPKVNLTQAELKHANEMGKAQADAIVAKFPPSVATDPNVAAASKNLGLYLGQSLALQANSAKLNEHFGEHHVKIMSGKSVTGVDLTPQDKGIISLHAQQMQADHAYLKTAQENVSKHIESHKAALLDAAKTAEGNLKTAGPIQLNDYDKGAVETAYTDAWSKTASKAVVFGIKTYAQKQEMKAHAEYAPLTQDLGVLRALAGKLALAHAAKHTAELNVPTDPETGHKLPGPEKKAWLDAAIDLSDTEQAFAKLHKVAQVRLDTIRTDVGLKKRALPKADAPAVKAAAAESGYYKSGSYSGPNYGKPAAAKNYMLAKVGPKFAVVHQTASEKKHEKLQNLVNAANVDAQAAKAKVGPATSAPKSNVPSVAEVGKTPNAAAAEKHGFKYVTSPAPVTGDWTFSSGPAYIADDAHLKQLQEHLGKEGTAHGLAAQKQFKWSINNMETKGASSSQKGSLYSYTGSGYASVNEKLNSLPPGAKKTGSTAIANIDAGIAASPPLDSDVVLYRGFKEPHSVFKSGKWNDVNVAGMEWSQRSYSSTSGALSTAQSFAGYGGVVMRIIIPKEMQVHGINAKGGQHAGENEVILQRGLRYRVVADYGKHGNTRYIDVMVVPNPYDQAQ